MDRAARESSSGSVDPILVETAFREIPGWHDDDHAAALAVFARSMARRADTPPKSRQLGVDGGRLASIARLLDTDKILDGESARGFLERNFTPFRIEAKGFVTGYFEPEIAASRTLSQRFQVPIYCRPADLVEVVEANRPRGWDPEIRFGRGTARGVEPYHDRAAIEAGALEGRGLEIAFVADPVDLFFIHVQGSARLRFEDGGLARIAFDGKSGHAYTSIGRLAVERGLLRRETADKEGLEAWLKAHPREGRALMRENRSFIFFRETRQKADEGPLGAAGVPLTPLRSLAVDRMLHTFHTPIWVDAPGRADPERKQASFRRLMLAEDTGSAIVGPARGDIFFGAGAEAGLRAGRVRHAATMVALVPRSPGS
jgi:membrane-bound lytic murein transglycosylase A